jgi:hypothetical protein
MDEIKWIAGVIISLITMIGGLIARDRQVHTRIEQGDADNMKKIEEIKRDYVRRDDLKDHLQAIEKSISQSRDEQRDLTRRIDNFIATMSNKPK